MDRDVDKALASAEEEACRRLANITKKLVDGRTRVQSKLKNVSTAEKLLQFFLTADNPRMTRRWAGILLEGLIHASEIIQKGVLALTDQLPSLGDITVHGHEELKLISAMVIRALASGGLQESLSVFWPAGSVGSQQIAKFPIGNSLGDKPWVSDLNTFLDDVFSQNRSADCPLKPTVSFIQAVEIDTEKSILTGDRSIYLIIQNGITITLTPPNCNEPFFLDIPLKKIVAFESQEKMISPTASSQHPSTLPQLLLQMRQGTWSYLMNTRQETANVIALTFSSIEQVVGAIETLKEESKELNLPKLSRSQTMDISKANEQTGMIEEQPPNLASEAVLPVETTDASEIQSKVTRQKEQNSRSSIGKLANLSQALSPEPDGLVKVTTPKKEARGVETGISEKRQTKEEKLGVALQKPKPTLATKKVSILPEKKQQYKSKTLSQIVVQLPLAGIEKRKSQLEDEKVYDFPDDSVDEDDTTQSQKKIGSRKSRKAVPKQPKGGSRSIPKRPVRKVVSDSETDENDEYVASQKLATIPSSGHRSTRPRTAKAVQKTEGTKKSLNVEQAESSATTSSKRDVQESVKAKEPGRGEVPKPTLNDQEGAKLIAGPETIEDFENAVTYFEDDLPLSHSILTESTHKLVPQSKAEVHAVGSSQQNPVQVPSDDKSEDALSDKVMETSEKEVEERTLKKTTEQVPDDTSKPNAISSPHQAEEEVIVQGRRPPMQQTGVGLTSRPVVHLEAPKAIPPLVDEQSARKMSIVSFSKSGPRNQGRLLSALSTPRTQHPRNEPTSEISTYGVGKQPKLNPAGSNSQPKQVQKWYDKVETLRVPFSEKRAASDDLPSSPSTKRRRPSVDEQDHDDYVYIDSIGIPEIAQQPSRRASQRSVIITDEGSPVPNDRLISPYVSSPPPCFRDTLLENSEDGPLPSPSGGSKPVFSVDARYPVSKALSSNRKYVPPPPESESQAISGYAPERVMREAAELSRQEVLKDPFSSDHQEGTEAKSMFMEKLSELVEIQPAQPQFGKHAEDGKKTLVEDTRMHDAESLSSSTEQSYEVIAPEDDSEGLYAKEMEWEAALQPRHRNILMVLSRISQRLISHLVDSETAIADIITDYNRDGSFIVGEMEKVHRRQYESMLVAFQASTEKASKRYSSAERMLENQHTSLQVSVKSELGKWKKGHEMNFQQLKHLEGLASMAG